MQPPVIKNIGILQPHPETHHLEILRQMIVRCGNGSVFVEDGVTDGKMTWTFLSMMPRVHGSELVLLGPVPDYVKHLIEKSGLEDRVHYELKTRPSLYFIGMPADPLHSAKQAIAHGSRVIVVYDVHSASRFRLPVFEGNRQAMEWLKQALGRRVDEVSRSIRYQQTHRGMFISEIEKWTWTEGQASYRNPPRVGVASLRPHAPLVALPDPVEPVKEEPKPDVAPAAPARKPATFQSVRRSVDS